MQSLYSTKQAAALTGVSRQALRTYTARYSRYLSTEATPAAGAVRQFTEADLRVLAFVYQQTKEGYSHDQVLAMLAAGDLEGWSWTPKQTLDGEEEDFEDTGGPQAGAAIVLHSQLQAVLAQLAAERAERLALQERLESLQYALGVAEGRLSVLQSQPAPSAKRPSAGWWARLVGTAAQ
jgi:DNA-binding transcriptional MerR regulator